MSGLLPTGTATLLADVEGSTRLWETRPDEMAAAIARLNRAVSEVVAAHRGVRPLDQGEGTDPTPPGHADMPTGSVVVCDRTPRAVDS